MDRPLRILHLEDDVTDGALTVETLRVGGVSCEITRVENQAAFTASLEQGGFDLILADYTLPSFDGLSALKLAVERRPEVPFIFLSGTLDEEVAIESLRVGATDYVFKTRLARLTPAVQRALRLARERAQRLEAEKALRRSATYLAETQRLMHTGSWAWDPGTRTTTYWSDEMFRIHGVPRLGQSPPLGEAFTHLIHPDDRLQFERSWATAQQERRDYTLDHRIVLPDGTVKHVRQHGHPVLDGAGAVVEWIGTSVDMTERKQAEEERRAHLWFLESMDRVHRAIQGTSDLERMMGDVLDAVLEIFGCDRSWLIYPWDHDAATCRPVMEHTRPEFPGAFALESEIPVDAEAASVFRIAEAADGAVLLGPGHEHQLPRQLAERFAIRSQMMMVLRPRGDRPYLFGVHQCSHPRRWTSQEQRLFEEIGHRLADALTGLLMFRGLRESERRLDRSQRMAHIGHWERDLDAGLVTLSDESCRIFGFPPEEQVVDLQQWHERWLTLIHPEDLPRVGEALAAALNGSAPYDVEYRVLRPGGDVRLIRSRCEVVRDDTGRPRRMMGMMQDVTDLRQAEYGLRESEARFRTFVDHATDAFFLHDDRLLVIDVNRQACASLGYTRDELIGMHPRDFDIGVDEATIGRLASRVGAGETVTFESLQRRKDGTVFPVEVRSGRFQQGDRLLRLSLVRDITERKRTEAELSEMRERFRILAESSLTGIYLTEGTRFVYVNPAMAKAFGYTVEELVGGGLGSLDLTCPDDRHLVGENMRRRLDGQVDELRYEFRGLRKDGSVFPVEVHGRRIELGGKVGILGTLIDNTERKRAEEQLREADSRFRAFVDHASDAFTVHDESGYIVDANRQACENLGYTREELIGMHPREFDSRIAADEALNRQIRQRLEAGEPFAFETMKRRKDGTLFPAEVRVRPFRHAGRLFRLALARDITDRKRAEEERERARRLEVEQQSAIAAERTRLAGEIHDTLAQGLAMMVMQLADAEAKLGPAWARAAKPLGMVRELAVESLAYARRSVTMLQPGAPAAGLARAIRDMVDSVRRHFGATLNFAVTGAPVLLPAPVESALAGIAREALTNAARHSSAARVDVELAFGDGGTVRLAVADDGVGFDLENVRSGGYGLTSMQDRAARAGVALTFVTEPGAGTEVVASWSQ